jgi:transposase-like protein
MTDDQLLALAKQHGVPPGLLYVWKRDPESLTVQQTTTKTALAHKLLAWARAVEQQY